jgi:hypothetical protein
VDEGEEGRGRRATGGSQASRSKVLEVQESRRAGAVSGAREQGWTMMHMKGQADYADEAVAAVPKPTKAQLKGQPLASDLALLRLKPSYWRCGGGLWLASRRPAGGQQRGHYRSICLGSGDRRARPWIAWRLIIGMGKVLVRFFG